MEPSITAEQKEEIFETLGNILADLPATNNLVESAVADASNEAARLTYGLSKRQFKNSSTSIPWANGAMSMRGFEKMGEKQGTEIGLSILGLINQNPDTAKELISRSMAIADSSAPSSTDTISNEKLLSITLLAMALLHTTNVSKKENDFIKSIVAQSKKDTMAKMVLHSRLQKIINKRLQDALPM